jgi:hypothetical protein
MRLQKGLLLASFALGSMPVIYAAGGQAGIVLKDVTRAAGIHFTHENGRAGKKWLPETMGSGVAFVDLDGDGWADLLFVNSKPWQPKGKKTLCALYRNNRNGTFTDVTAHSGLDLEMFGMGVAVADYDNDGRPDVYITAIDGDRLFHNEGGLKFRDVTKAAGISNANFATSAAWVDYDRDGKADLVVANYVEWTAKGDKYCSMDGATKSYCTPEAYPGRPLKLYHNLGNGRFVDVATRAGLDDAASKSLGIATFDYNNDGWPDLFIANDTQPNKLYRNNKNGTFTEEGVGAGVAFGEDGVARGAMGVDFADVARTGREDLIVGNFSNQMLALYRNDGSGLFTDRAPRTPLGRSSLFSLTFGVFFFDYDLDGYPDIFALNGHIDEDINKVQPKIRYEEAPLLFRNSGKGNFEDVTKSAGEALARPLVGRGAAYADFDHDGDLDVVVTTNGGPAYLLRNDGGNRNQWLTVRLEGGKSNRSALGAVVTVESASGKQTQTVHSGSSYLSQSDLALTFGLGRDGVVKTMEIRWPSGRVDRKANLKANQFLNIREGQN